MGKYNSNPTISVLMPVFNGEKFIREAIESILNQTYSDFEFIIINDGSIDKSEEIILSYNDPRIIYLKNEKNLRLIETLNKGIKIANGKYIARMDADDIALSHRLQSQLNLFKKYNCNVTSGSYLTINEYSQKIGFHVGIKAKTVDAMFMSLFVCPLAHPTVMVETEVMKKYMYTNCEAYLHIEDYEIWTRMLLNGIKFYISNNPLIKYRRSELSVTTKYRELSINNQINISQRIQSIILGYSISDKSIRFILNDHKEQINLNQVLSEVSQTYPIYKKVKKNKATQNIRNWISYRLVISILKCKNPFKQKLQTLISHPTLTVRSILFLLSNKI